MRGRGSGRAENLLHFRIRHSAGLERRSSRVHHVLRTTIPDLSKGLEDVESRQIVEDMQPYLSWQRLVVVSTHLTA